MAIVKKVFTNTGALQNFTVPAGVSAINLKVWGAAGGPRGAFFSQAGAGGYSSGTVAVVPGQVLDVMVGSKGVAVSTLPTFGGGGGGGGAGPGSETTANLGGNGGGSSGNTTTFLNGGANLTPAQGGTQVAGGAGATNAVNPGTNGLAGSSLQGGSGGPEAISILPS